MTIHRGSALAAAVAAGFLAGGVGTADAETTIRLAHTLNPTDARHLAAERFGEILADKSGGEITVEVYPSSQLGKQTEIFEGMNLGTVEMNIAGSTHLANLVPTFGVFDLPYLAPDVDSFMALVDGEIGEELLSMLPAVGIRGLAFSEVGFRHLYTTAPIESFDDVSGKKMRVPGNPVYRATLGAFGADPTPMALGEVFTAMQQGAIDGAENLVSFYRNSGHWEVADNLAMTYHAALPSVWMISESFWQDLDPETQAMIAEAASEAAMYERALSAELRDTALAELPEVGVTITEPDLAPFREAAASVWDEHRERIGPELIERIETSLQ